ncbi:MAG: hypothetical protein IH933_01620 [Euryarchaeota archaeon]|jgi:hypothetical protein|nr:hypothetical protein [Euryarchaeota archaeon]
MFANKPRQEGGNPQSWYGESQHEEVDGCEWETAYYGETQKEISQGNIEFIPEIEYPAEFLGEIPRAVGRRLRPLFVN